MEVQTERPYLDFNHTTVKDTKLLDDEMDKDPGKGTNVYRLKSRTGIIIPYYSTKVILLIVVKAPMGTYVA